MPLDERVKIRIKLEAQKILRSKGDIIDDRLEKLNAECKKARGDRKEATELLVSLIEQGLEEREVRMNDQ